MDERHSFPPSFLLSVVLWKRREREREKMAWVIEKGGREGGREEGPASQFFLSVSYLSALRE